MRSASTNGNGSTDTLRHATASVVTELIDEGRQPSSSVPEVVSVDAPVIERLAAPPRLAVPIVVGTRPEAIKLVPIILAMKESDSYQPIVISTGQHHRMVQEIFELAGIATDVTLWAGGRRELNERVSSVMKRFEDFIVEWFGIPPQTITAKHVTSGRFPATSPTWPTSSG